jgi:hypothetical protein
MTFETDYLVIGAGASGLAFADELVRRSDAHVTLVDRRDAPGGHWNDVYPFVRLHQPASFYGVESIELDRGELEASGPNAGWMSLSEGPEIVAYFHRVWREKLLPTGRVRFIPMSEAEPGDAPGPVTVRHRLSGERTSVTVRRKVVDAARFTNAVPATHQPGFEVAAGVTCVPPNDLPRRAAGFGHHVVLGAGKTAIDALCWLLSHGAPASSITWVVPRDSWFFNRAKVQPTMAHFDGTFTSAAEQREAMAAATSVRDLAQRMEACGAWLRLDRSIEPTMFHFATLSEGELGLLRRVGRTIRMGRVTAVERGRLRLQRGEVEVPSDSLFVDCTASALSYKPPVPVFAGPRITIQMVRIPQPTFSAALTAFLETQPGSDDERNACMRPVVMTDTVDDYPRSQVTDLANRHMAARIPAVRDWLARSRLEGFTHLLAAIGPGDVARQAIVQRIRAASPPAFENLQRLAAATGGASA